jgi:hypothetical protein
LPSEHTAPIKVFVRPNVISIGREVVGVKKRAAGSKWANDSWARKSMVSAGGATGIGVWPVSCPNRQTGSARTGSVVRCCYGVYDVMMRIASIFHFAGVCRGARGGQGEVRSSGWPLLPERFRGRAQKRTVGSE